VYLRAQHAAILFNKHLCSQGRDRVFGLFWCVPEDIPTSDDSHYAETGYHELDPADPILIADTDHFSPETHHDYDQTGNNKYDANDLFNHPPALRLAIDLIKPIYSILAANKMHVM
jgi:hypothetical protein